MKEFLVSTSILAILASMLVPLPPAIIDFLLAGNLLLALVLIFSSLYIEDPLKLSSLPTILLLATLYRLALNISTTRAILGQGNAGHLVDAFGSFVVQGNLVVGLIVFIVITLVQFIVIAKGAERVAEVSARFSLDALPGKQMSIDAEVRSGLLDSESARRKREELQTESRFYGALDGAMKFVKGDAIAGICIAAINIVGGLVVGVAYFDLSLGESVRKFTLLTVGDGLMSQIPALLNALAAGMVVTRVIRVGGRSLAADLLDQLGQVNRVKVIVAIFFALAACVPAVPGFPFITLAALLLVSAAFGGLKKEEEVVAVFTPKAPPLIGIELGPEIVKRIPNVKDYSKQLERFREGVFARYGVVLPTPHSSVASDLGAGLRIKLRGVAVLEQSSEASDCGITPIVKGLEEIARLYLDELVDDVLTRQMLDYYDQSYPELIANVVPAIVTVTQLSLILKCLLREGVPITTFDQILQALAEAAPTARGERALLEEARVGLRRVISSRFCGTDRALECVSIDPLLDLALTKAERDQAVIDPEAIAYLVTEIQKLPPGSWSIVVSKCARKLLRESLVGHGIKAVVLAHEEIVDGLEQRWIHHIALEADGMSNNLVEELAA